MHLLCYEYNYLRMYHIHLVTTTTQKKQTDFEYVLQTRTI